MRIRTRLLALALFAACSDRPVTGGGGTTDAGPLRPESGPWAPCASQEDCDPLPYCVFPQGEPGFCTEACEADDACPAAYGTGPSAQCVDVGADRPVCALPCGTTEDCPPMMRCQAVLTPGGERRICF